MSDTIEEGGLGEADIEAAYGSGDGDLDTSATVASTPKGQIFEQIYRPWNGPLGPRWVRNYAIYRHHVYGIISGSGLTLIPTKIGMQSNKIHIIHK